MLYEHLCLFYLSNQQLLYNVLISSKSNRIIFSFDYRLSVEMSSSNSLFMFDKLGFILLNWIFIK